MISARPTATPQNTEASPSDQRSSPRIDLEVEVNIDDHTNFYVGFSENVSEGGLFIATYSLRPVGSKLEVAFTLPNEYTVAAAGTVRWLRDPRDLEDSDAPPGMGIQFSELSDEDREQIRAFTQCRAPIFYPD